MASPIIPVIGSTDGIGKATALELATRVQKLSSTGDPGRKGYRSGGNSKRRTAGANRTF